MRLYLFLILLLPFAAAAATPTGVGMAPIEVPDPIGGEPMPGFVFYPSPVPVQATTAVGPYHVAAAFGLPSMPGARPLVVVSHGNGGSNLGHHDLATHLASNGFIVATLEHPGDNHRDQSGVGHASVMAGRPLQVSAVITALLENPRWQPMIDADRIGVAGFSAGGYTSLMVVGAAPRLDRFIGYCERHPKDPVICADAGRLAAAAIVDGRTIEEFLAVQQADMDRWGDTRDARVGAAFVMAPLSLVFDEAGASAIDRPVHLYYSEADRVLPPAENALHLQPLVSTLVETTAVPDADHWVFLAPCSPELASNAAAICSDPPGVDRAAVHRRINADAVSFFRETFAVQRH